MASCGRWPPLGVQKLRNMMKIHSKLKLAHFRTRPASTQGSQGVGRGRGREGATINEKEGGGGAIGVPLLKKGKRRGSILNKAIIASICLALLSLLTASNEVMYSHCLI